MKKFPGVFKVLIILIISMRLHFAMASPLSSPPFVKLDKSYEWTFQSEGSNSSFPVRPGAALVDQMKYSQRCCSGTYLVKVEVKNIRQIGKPGEVLAIYLPAIGGNASIEISGNPIHLPEKEYSSIGPIIPLEDRLLHSSQFELKIHIESKPSNLSGLWKGAPIIGTIPEIIKVRDSDYLIQQVVPVLDSTILGILAGMFLLIHLSLNGKNQNYLVFSWVLASWSVFYFFLSGIPREWNFSLGANLHYPVRLVAAIGFFALTARYCNFAYGRIKNFSFYFLGLALINLGFGVTGHPILQKTMLALTGSVAFYPLLFFKWKKANNLQKAAFFCAILAFAGQSSDAIKLMEGVLKINYPLPFLNRYTFLPLLFLSFCDCVIQFAGSFHELRINLFRARGYARLSQQLATRRDVEAELGAILRNPRRLTRVARISLLQRTEEENYRVLGVNGIHSDAIGNNVLPSAHSHIQATIQNGVITIVDLQKTRGKVWNTTRCAAVPVPAIQNPPFLLLLSDPVSPLFLNHEDIPYLSQFSAALWSNIQKNREMQSRIAAEKRFSSIVQILDPNLYQFISKNPEVSKDSVDRVHTRGIIFFDQKNFSTLMETLSEVKSAEFTGFISHWVAESAAKFGAMVTDFIGDAYMLELFGLQSESNAQLAKRTVDLVWELCDSLGNLNKSLMARGFPPISFRFGAHLGKVSNISLDFIKPGLKASVGDNVNVAARIQTNAPSGRILVSGALSEHLEEYYIFKSFDRAFVKGRSGLVPIFEVVAKVNEVASAV